MQRTIHIIVVAAIFVSPIAQARIGETEEQIQARYGPPIAMPEKAAAMARKLPGSAKFYHASDLTVGVGYLDGTSAVEIYSKGDSSALSQDEIKIVLDANSGEAQWVRSPGLIPMWQLTGTDRIAVSMAGVLMVCTQAYLDRSTGKNAEEAKERLKKF